MIFASAGSRSTHRQRLLPFFCHFSSFIAQFAPSLNEFPLKVKTRDFASSSFNTLPRSSETRSCIRKIKSLGRCGKVEAARKLFDEMPHGDVNAYASMITVYLKNGDLLKAEKLFQDMPQKSVIAETAMIDGYMKAGLASDASRIFDGMCSKNVVTWTAMVDGYSGMGQIDVARSLFDLMPEKNVVSWTAMIKAYVEHEQIEEARKLFDEMPHRNLYSWNIMISGYLNENRVTEAISLFQLMPHRNPVSWTTMVTGLARNGEIADARKYFDQMPDKDIPAYNAMITAYAGNGFMNEVAELFNLMPDRDVVTWNAIIHGYADSGIHNKALRLFTLMFCSSARPNEKTLATVLPSCEAVTEVTQMHGLIILLGFESHALTSNAVISAYSRSGDLESAKVVFERLLAKDVVSWTAMISAFAIHGCGAHALGVFASMIRSGANPDGITLLGVLLACRHAGFVEKGMRLYRSISKAYSVELTNEHYSCFVDLLARAGLVDEANRFVSQMPPGQCDAPILTTLVGAQTLEEGVELRRLGERLIELEPEACGGYVQLANIFATHGKWDEVAKTRKQMKDRNLKKFAGYSAIVVQTTRHLFYVGDRRHPQTEEIYAMLNDELLPSMKEMDCTSPSVCMEAY